MTDLNLCTKSDCDINRVFKNYRYLTSLSYHWNQKNHYTNTVLIRFIRRAQTSLLQYDEHNRQLWFTHDTALHCLNLKTDSIDYSYESDYDDILCYKVYNDDLICTAHGNLLRIICRRTNDIYSCYTNWHLQALPSERNDILSLDIYSNDQERYLILNGSRDHTVLSKSRKSFKNLLFLVDIVLIFKVRTFDMPTHTNRILWCTKLDDRVLCSRFTNDGQYFLVGTGGTSNPYPLVLFNTEKAQPIHV